MYPRVTRIRLVGLRQCNSNLIQCTKKYCGINTTTVWLVIFARYLFSRFSRVKSHSRKLKPQKFCCPRVKRTNCVSIPGLLLYSSLQKRVSECAFDGYHWSNPKCYVITDARSRQRRKAESRSNLHTHRSRKLKTRKSLKSGYFAKICTRENYQPYGTGESERVRQFFSDSMPFYPSCLACAHLQFCESHAHTYIRLVG